MSAIQSSVGLISGIPIQDTVDQLIAFSARPRDRLVKRNEGLAAERAAIDQLSTLTLSAKFSLNSLSRVTAFRTRSVTSSNAAALSATAARGATPAVGSYTFTPLRAASGSQFVSSRFESIEELGGGKLSFGYGGQVDRGVSLAKTNSGGGFNGGQLRITDASGSTAVIDLRAARSVDDILEAINTAADVDVTASTSGGRFVITDESGGDGELAVREVNGGDAAEELGLLNTSVDGVLTGDNIFGIGAGTKLSELRDGLGVRITGETGLAANSVQFTLGDGTTSTIDFGGAQTLGDVVDKINESTELGGKLTATIADGARIELTDSTSGNLVVRNFGGGTLATDLGIETDATGVDTTLTGARLTSGLKDTLVSTLAAGEGLDLRVVSFTDRSGKTANVDLAGAETLGEIVDKINAADVGLVAAVNDARNGLEIRDTSGGDGSLVIADVGAGTTAAALGIAVDDAVDSVDTGSLRRQTVGLGTLLENYAGGRGVELGDIRIIDAAGFSRTIDLDKEDDPALTIGDVIDRINASGVGVAATLNDDGDGILLTDTTGGAGVLSVEEVGRGKTAASLGLLGDATATNEAGLAIIDGGASYEIDLTELDTTARGVGLSRLNSGDGVNLGIIEVTASTGVSFTVDLGVSRPDAQTIGEVIDRINAAAAEANVAVEAKINAGNSGIELVDNTGGGGSLEVEDLTGRAAVGLRLNRNAQVNDKTRVQTINGSGLFTHNEANALKTLTERINDLGAGVTAAVFNDGQGFRLSLTSDRTGDGADLLVDGLGASLDFTQTSRASDAVAVFGGFGGVGGFAVTSSTNTFDGIVEGVTVELKQATGEPVTVNVQNDSAAAGTAIGGFVEAYNSLRSSLADLTSFDAETQTTGLLFGRGETLRLDTDLSRVLLSTFRVEGEFSSLQEVGISLKSDGTLTFDQTRLTRALRDSPDSVEKLFRTPETGVVARISAMIDQLAGEEKSLLGARSEAIQSNITSNEQRIDTLSARLDRERERLLLDFIQLEDTIALLQSNNTFLESIQPVQRVSSGSRS